MSQDTYHGCCDTCKHYRKVTMRSMEGLLFEEGFCHASSTYAKHEPSHTCKRWAASRKSINR